MSRYLYTILIIILVLTGVVVPSEKVFADSCWNPSAEKPIPTAKTQEDCEKDGGKWVVTDPKTGQATTGAGTENPGVFANAMYKVVARVANIILSIAALLTTLSGYLLNGVVYHTIVNVSENYNNLKPIEEAWRVIRDISNMAFIFVLLYAGIRTIFGVGEDNQKVVKNVVLAAILINFSMFFTRVVIDISNVFALTFYDAIAPGVAAKGFELGQAGLSNAFSQYLSYQTLYQMAGNIDLNGIITTAIMGTIMLIIVSFVFFAIAIMFIIRYVVLLLVIILSPIYFISLALPKGTGIGAYSQQWLNALIGQAFFAPIYFLMTWVAVRVMGGIMTALQVPGATGAEATSSALSGLSIGDTLSSGAFMMFINFAIVMVLIVTALIVAKQWASMAGGGVSSATKWFQGAAGNFVAGGVGKLGRAGGGVAGTLITKNPTMQTWANEEKGAKGAAGRLALYAGKKMRSGTFDVRNAAIPTNIIGDAIEGTIGRRKAGKFLGLDEVRVTPSIKVGQFANSIAGLGQAGKEGYKEEQEAKAKRLDTIRRANEEEYRKVINTDDINSNLAEMEEFFTLNASVAASGGTPTAAQAARLATLKATNGPVEKFEKALAKMTDKEVEAIVDSNHELLKSAAFANAISVKQLEALNKTDKLSDAEKDQLKGSRFSTINNAMGASGAGASSVGKNIKGLTDTEMEMIDPAYLKDPSFVAQMKSSQIESALKSNKYTSSQKASLREARNEPLLNALDTSRGASHIPNPALVKDMLTKRLTAKDIAGFASTKIDFIDTYSGASIVQGSLLTHPEVMENYNPKMLKQMTDVLTPSDVTMIRNAIEDAYNSTIATPTPNPKIVSLHNWLTNDDGINNFS